MALSLQQLHSLSEVRRGECWKRAERYPDSLWFHSRNTLFQKIIRAFEQDIGKSSMEGHTRCFKPESVNQQWVEMSRKVSFGLHAQLLPFLMSSLQPQTRGGWPCVHTCFSPHRKCSHTCVGVFATLCIPLCDEKHTPHLCAVTRAYLLFPLFFLFH